MFEARGENTIAIAPGNKLRVVEEHGSGWTYVKNYDTGKCGWVPAWVAVAGTGSGGGAAVKNSGV